MEPVCAAFEAAGYPCHSLTYRYHDLPSGPDRDAKLVGVSIADFVEDARQEIERVGARPIVVGHSLGGVVAQLFAGEGAVRAGVLLNSSIVNGVLPTTDGERELGKLFISAGALWDQTPQKDLALRNAYGLNTLPEALQRDIHARLDSESGQVLFEFVFWMYDVNRTTRVDPRKVTCPLLFVSGTEDLAVATSTARVMADRYATAEVLAVDGACHYVQFDRQWPATASKALEWLSGKL